MAALATDGILWKPRLVDRVEDRDGRVELSPLVFQFLRRALSGVVNDGGTGQAGRCRSGWQDGEVPECSTAGPPGA